MREILDTIEVEKNVFEVDNSKEELRKKRELDKYIPKKKKNN